MQQAAPFLMFDGKAKQAIDLYVSVFKNSRIVSIAFYDANMPGAEGTVSMATIVVNGLEIMCTDSPVKHAFGFTPAISIFVKCGTVEEVDAAFAQLADGGQVMMPLDKYPFSERFGWVADKFGVSWQLSLVK